MFADGALDRGVYHYEPQAHRLVGVAGLAPGDPWPAGFEEDALARILALADPNAEGVVHAVLLGPSNE